MTARRSANSYSRVVRATASGESGLIFDVALIANGLLDVLGLVSDLFSSNLQPQILLHVQCVADLDPSIVADIH